MIVATCYRRTGFELPTAILLTLRVTPQSQAAMRPRLPYSEHEIQVVCAIGLFDQTELPVQVGGLALHQRELLIGYSVRLQTTPVPGASWLSDVPVRRVFAYTSWKCSPCLRTPVHHVPGPYSPT